MEILEDFPTLTENDVRAVIAFAAASAEDDLPVPAVPNLPREKEAKYKFIKNDPVGKWILGHESGNL